MIKRVFSIIISLFLIICNTFFPNSPLQIKMTVQKMTLEQRIGQMIMPAFRTWNGENVTELNDSIRGAIEKYGFGGIILFAENCQGTEQTTRLVADIKKTCANSSSGIAPLISIDQEGGYIIRLQTGTGTVGNMALGAINNTDITREDAQRIGAELSAMGINTDFAPVMDVNCNPSNPVIGIRSFSSDPNIAARMGEAFISGLHISNVGTALKHFPGHGDTATDSHTGLPLINKSYDELNKMEFIPFRAGIKAGTDLIMTAHIVFPQIEKETYTSISTGKKINLPATLSKTILTDILRNEMKFNGVITTDAMNMDAIAANFNPTDAAVLAINAGVDMLLMPVNATNNSSLTQFDTYIQNIVSAVKSGKINIEKINKSVERILTLKSKRGILDEKPVSTDEQVKKALQVVGCKQHHTAELATAEKAVTVLKNANNTLPLKTTDKAAFFYPYTGEADSLTFGVHTVNPSLNVPTYCYRNSSADDYNNVIKSVSTLIIYTEAYSASYFNPSSASGWQAVFVQDMINKAHSLGKKVVIVSIHLPYDVAKYTNADAILLAYGAKDMKTVPTKWNGEVKTFGINIPASAAVIFGGAKPQGKLPVDIYRLDSNNQYTSQILFPLGTGLSLNFN